MIRRHKNIIGETMRVNEKKQKCIIILVGEDECNTTLQHFGLHFHSGRIALTTHGRDRGRGEGRRVALTQGVREEKRLVHLPTTHIAPRIPRVHLQRERINGENQRRSHPRTPSPT